MPDSLDDKGISNIQKKNEYNLVVSDTIKKVIKQRKVSAQDFFKKLGNDELFSDDVLTGVFDFDVIIKKQNDNTLEIKIRKLGLITFSADKKKDIETSIIECVTLLSHLTIDYGK